MLESSRMSGCRGPASAPSICAAPRMACCICSSDGTVTSTRLFGCQESSDIDEASQTNGHQDCMFSSQGHLLPKQKAQSAIDQETSIFIRPLLYVLNICRGYLWVSDRAILWRL